MHPAETQGTDAASNAFQTEKRIPQTAISRGRYSGLWERFGEQLASRVEREANPQLIGHPSVRVKVRMQEVGGRAALRGAAKVGLRRFIDNPLPLLTSLSD